MKNTHFNKNIRNSRTYHGFTLIETLVVMVVLLIGILAVVRLFPGGFLAIQNTAEQTNGRALAEQQLRQLESTNGLPDAVVSASYDNNGNVVINPNVLPSETKDYTSSNLPPEYPAGTDPHYVSDINRFRRILGEMTLLTVPDATAANGYGPVVTLRHGPVYNAFSTDTLGNLTDSIAVNSRKMERLGERLDWRGSDVEADSLPITDEQYILDLNDGNPLNARVGFKRRQGSGLRRFSVTWDAAIQTGFESKVFPLVAGSPNTVVVVNDDLNNDSGVQWVPLISQPALLPENTVAIRPNSEQVSRKFHLVQTGTSLSPDAPQWTNDAYEYAWYSKQNITVHNDGVLVFNPRITSKLVQTDRGVRLPTVRIDYETYDNHILRDNLTIPARAPYTIRTSVGGILLSGDKKSTQADYNGMFREATASPDIILLDPVNGVRIGERKSRGTGFNGTIPFSVDGKFGVISLNKRYVEANNLAGKAVRVLYQANKEWGMQIQRAAAQYVQSQTPYASDITYRSFYAGGTVSGVGNTHRVYFPICEAGKTVQIGDYWVNTSSGVQKFSGETFVTNDNPALFETFNGQRLTWIDLSDQHSAAADAGSPWTFTTASSGRSVNNVKGVSVKSRVIWRTNTRWKTAEDVSKLTDNSD